MTEQDNILLLAEKHCICTSGDSKEFDHDGLLAFVAAVKAETVAETREACAKACDRVAELAGRFAKRGSNEFDCGAVDGAEHCAESIRAMAATPSREGEP